MRWPVSEVLRGRGGEGGKGRRSGGGRPLDFGVKNRMRVQRMMGEGMGGVTYDLSNLTLVLFVANKYVLSIRVSLSA
jgi:hypothetical protein